MSMPMLPVPDIPIRKRKAYPECDCGACPQCAGNAAKRRYYRRRKAGISPRPYRATRLGHRGRWDACALALHARFEAEGLELLASFGVQILPTGGIQ